MNAVVREEVLKGGSLNRTVLRLHADGTGVVRKSVSRAADREYGFVRWHSQFKRLQRYNALFPDLFPEVCDAGVEGDGAYFDLAYVPGSVNLKEHLCAPTDPGGHDQLADAVLAAADRMHDMARLGVYAHSLELYFAEEVTGRLKDACADAGFRAFCEQPELVFNGAPCPSLLQNLDWLRGAFAGLRPSAECYTHGNMTLENILLTPSSGRIVFIDPYEENVVDCREAEYSQVLQCSRSHYGFVNDRSVRIEGREVAFAGRLPAALLAFNAAFEARLERRLSAGQLRLTALLEATQFTRMLPFKLAIGELDKAKYFYTLASSLVQQLRCDPR